MARNEKSRIYTRNQGGETRYYADFREFADVGGAREALKEPGQSTATTDPEIAAELAERREQELKERRRSRVFLGVERQASLSEFADYHLRAKAKAGRVTARWLEQEQYQLQAAVEFFGGSRELSTIRTRDVQRWLGHLREQSNGRGETLADSTVRKFLNSLSNVYRRAASEGYVPPGLNPVAALMDKPSGRTRREAAWLEVHDAALLLEAARAYSPRADAFPFMYPLVATFLLTGGRNSEVLGLEVDDVSFDRRTVTFRPNAWRRLKTSTSHRSVPLWGQLEEILREYIFGGPGPRGGLLFPSVEGKSQRLVRDLRRSLDAITQLAGLEKPSFPIRTKVFRHTYCAARLQTLDRGAPVPEFTVAREMGHGGFSMVRRVYGHLGKIRHRSEEPEFRVEQHEEKIRERLRALRAAVA